MSWGRVFLSSVRLAGVWSVIQPQAAEAGEWTLDIMNTGSTSQHNPLQFPPQHWLILILKGSPLVTQWDSKKIYWHTYMPWLNNSFTQYSLWVILLQKSFRNNKAYFLPLKKSDQSFFFFKWVGWPLFHTQVLTLWGITNRISLCWVSYGQVCSSSKCLNARMCLS